MNVPEPSRRRVVAYGAAALAASGLLALAGATIVRAMPGSPDRAVLLTVALDAATLLGVLGVLFVRRRTVSLGAIGLTALGMIAAFAVASYLISIASQVGFRADILIWSESDFVNDIVKLRTGHPLYGAPSDLNSFNYPPLTQLLTYGIASLVGHATSIPTYRAIQIGYIACASLLATLATWRLLRIAAPDATRDARWGLVWAPLLFLFGTNTVTNPYSHNLHDDALSVLVAAAAFLLLVEYAASRKPVLLVGLATIPAIGFLVKQSLVIWGPLVVAYLVLCDRPRSWRRSIPYAVGGGALALSVYAACLLVFGEHFSYWVITVLGNHPVSPLRSALHVLEAWAFFAALLIGALALLRRDVVPRLLGPWLVAAALLSVEAWTSGVAWMLNHMGPGSLLAGVWVCAALAAWWPRTAAAAETPPSDWLQVGAAVGLGALALSAIGAVHLPRPTLPEDAYRYVAEIEREFANANPERVLLDHGTWLYSPRNIVMRDRSATAGEAGYTGTADFSGMLDRIRDRQYEKILVRDLHGPQFIYDYWMWDRPSGVREALLEHYHEVRVIPAVRGEEHGSPWYRPISVLVPRTE